MNFGAEAVLALDPCVGSAVSLVCHSKVLCSVSNTSVIRFREDSSKLLRWGN